MYQLWQFEYICNILPFHPSITAIRFIFSFQAQVNIIVPVMFASIKASKLKMFTYFFSKYLFNKLDFFSFFNSKIYIWILQTSPKNYLTVCILWIIETFKKNSTLLYVYLPGQNKDPPLCVYLLCFNFFDHI